jgi:hypothetical protein
MILSITASVDFSAGAKKGFANAVIDAPSRIQQAMFSPWRTLPEPISPVIGQALCTVVRKSTVSIPQLMNGAAISCSLIEPLRASSILAELVPLQ